ncbi:hypothetical protein V8G54_023682 [Vigna mungo]|uniref:Uncharacterized protein n=1 Tax=Vigna mungo TaxID=3915 RepID=A0AAQ3N5E2_VIGMU
MTGGLQACGSRWPDSLKQWSASSSGRRFLPRTRRSGENLAAGDNSGDEQRHRRGLGSQLLVFDSGDRQRHRRGLGSRPVVVNGGGRVDVWWRRTLSGVLVQRRNPGI